MNKESWTYILSIIAVLVAIYSALSLFPTTKKEVKETVPVTSEPEKELTDDEFLCQCFDKQELNDFKKYQKLSRVIKVDGGIVYVTPTKHVQDIPQISWNGWFLNNLCVDPKRRGQGIGTQLVKDVVQQAGNSGLDHVILQVLEDNKPAVAIYKKLGFVEHSKGMNQKNQPAIVFAKYL